jgi:hypothetical protein
MCGRDLAVRPAIGHMWGPPGNPAVQQVNSVAISAQLAISVQHFFSAMSEPAMDYRALLAQARQMLATLAQQAAVTVARANALIAEAWRETTEATVARASRATDEALVALAGLRQAEAAVEASALIVTVGEAIIDARQTAEAESELDDAEAAESEFYACQTAEDADMEAAEAAESELDEEAGDSLTEAEEVWE